MKPKKIWLRDTIFKIDYFVVRGGTCNAAIEEFSKQTKNKFDNKEDNLNTRGYYLFDPDSKEILIWFHAKAGTEAIVHEVYHAATSMLGHCGIYPSPETGEVFAYYIGFLTKEICKALWWKKK